MNNKLEVGVVPLHLALTREQLGKRIEELEAKVTDLHSIAREQENAHVNARMDASSYRDTANQLAERVAKLQSLIDAALGLADEWDATAGDPGTNLVRFDCANELRALLERKGADDE